MRVRLHPEARAELREARWWYDERSPLTATAFAHAVDTAVSKIVGVPTQYPLTELGTRKLVLSRFPFNIFYLPGESEIVIVRGTSETAAGLLGQPSASALVVAALAKPSCFVSASL